MGFVEGVRREPQLPWQPDTVAASSIGSTNPKHTSRFALVNSFFCGTGVYLFLCLQNLLAIHEGKNLGTVSRQGEDLGGDVPSHTKF